MIEKKTAPTDKACERAWHTIMALAEANALIVQAYSGVATLALPSEQRKANIRAQVLTMHVMKEGS